MLPPNKTSRVWVVSHTSYCSRPVAPPVVGKCLSLHYDVCEVNQYNVCKLNTWCTWVRCSADVASFLHSCQAGSGGYGGGPRQMAHLAPTYAAIASLVTLGGEAALDSIDRVAVLAFLQAMAVPPGQGGGFHVCQGTPAFLGKCPRHLDRGASHCPLFVVLWFAKLPWRGL